MSYGLSRSYGSAESEPSPVPTDAAPAAPTGQRDGSPDVYTAARTLTDLIDVLRSGVQISAELVTAINEASDRLKAHFPNKGTIPSRTPEEGKEMPLDERHRIQVPDEVRNELLTRVDQALDSPAPEEMRFWSLLHDLRNEYVSSCRSANALDNAHRETAGRHRTLIDNLTNELRATKEDLRTLTEDAKKAKGMQPSGEVVGSMVLDAHEAMEWLRSLSPGADSEITKEHFAKVAEVIRALAGALDLMNQVRPAYVWNEVKAIQKAVEVGYTEPKAIMRLLKILRRVLADAERGRISIVAENSRSIGLYKQVVVLQDQLKEAKDVAEQLGRDLNNTSLRLSEDYKKAAKSAEAKSTKTLQDAERQWRAEVQKARQDTASQMQAEINGLHKQLDEADRKREEALKEWKTFFLKDIDDLRTALTKAHNRSRTGAHLFQQILDSPSVSGLAEWRKRVEEWLKDPNAPEPSIEADRPFVVGEFGVGRAALAASTKEQEKALRENVLRARPEFKAVQLAPFGVTDNRKVAPPMAMAEPMDQDHSEVRPLDY